MSKLCVLVLIAVDYQMDGWLKIPKKTHGKSCFKKVFLKIVSFMSHHLTLSDHECGRLINNNVSSIAHLQARHVCPSVLSTVHSSVGSKR